MLILKDGYVKINPTYINDKILKYIRYLRNNKKIMKDKKQKT